MSWNENYIINKAWQRKAYIVKNIVVALISFFFDYIFIVFVRVFVIKNIVGASSQSIIVC
ncbi:hypothetical protein CBP34_06325 [Acidovorax carolinensis]|uniref:Uncharacterized protein n=1 Tax=Acidovorax carolinensis TaxID=553814 RepID=A0A240U1S7_9BURK|nr:hypothetical protein CBP34_06325 [Acidovorax carolinensis]